MESEIKEVFTEHNLDEYRKDGRILKALNGSILVNHDEFMAWYTQPEIKISARTQNLMPRQPSIEKVKHISKETLTDLANNVCENKIGINYGKESILSLNKETFDILVVLAPNADKVKAEEAHKQTKTSVNKKLKHILGFIIVQKAECRRYPNTYSVRLICARTKLEYQRYGKSVSQQKRERVRGGILLGAYMHCVKKLYATKRHPPGIPIVDETMGILELAAGYKNIAGFFSYSNMGFVKDLSLLGRDCFNDVGNLPMSVKLSNYTHDKIITLATGEVKLQNIQDDTGLIDLVPRSKRQEALQKLIAVYCNLIYQWPYVYDDNFRLNSIKHGDEIKILQTFENEYYEELGHDPHRDDYIDFLTFQKNLIIQEFHKKTPTPSPLRTPTPNLVEAVESLHSKSPKKTPTPNLVEGVESLHSKTAKKTPTPSPKKNKTAKSLAQLLGAYKARGPTLANDPEIDTNWK